MGLFDAYLNEGGILVKPDALSYEYAPRTIRFRDSEMQTIAYALRPLLQGRQGRNILITGPPGIGKTLVVRHVLTELDDVADVLTGMVNCWKTGTAYRILLSLVEDVLDYHFTQNKTSEDLARMLSEAAQAQPSVFVLDEADKAQDLNFIYTLIEDAYLASLILVTNDTDWYAQLDNRLRSRLMPIEIPFQPYTLEEVREILRERAQSAFRTGSLPDDVLRRIAVLTHEAGDIRYGLFLLREAAEHAEAHFRKEITLEDLERARAMNPDFARRPKEDLDDVDSLILSLVKEKEWTSGTLYRAVSMRIDVSYKTFQRRITKLAEGGYILLEKATGEQGGRTTRIRSVIR